MGQTKKPGKKPAGTKSDARAEDIARPEATERNESAVEEGATELDKLKLVTRLLNEVAHELEQHKPKASLSDFIKLLELQKELEDEVPKAIEVTWVEPDEKA